MSAPAKIYIALRDRLDALPFAVVEPGETYPTSPDTPFILIQDDRLDVPRQFVTTNSPDVRRGIFALSVMVPLNWSHAQIMGIAGAIETQFAKGTILTKDGVTVRMEKVAQPVSSAYRDDAFNRLPVQVYWRVVA